MEYLTVAGEYIVWWYSGGLKRLYLWLAAVFGSLSSLFSISRVLKTLFSPWKRLVGVRKPGLEGFRDWLLDNLISRFVGFFARLIVIMAYLFSVAIFAVIAAVSFVFWTFWPLVLAFVFLKIFI